MAINIDRLLKKKSWTGEEVGKALMASVINDIKNQDSPDYTPLFTQETLEKMEDTLKTDEDYIIYAIYRDLFSSVLDAYNKGQGLFQQVYHGYTRYSNNLLMCQQADEALKRAESYPLIMTQSQYDRSMLSAKHQLQSHKDAFATVFMILLEQFVDYPKTAPNGIGELIEATIEEAVTNKRVLSSFHQHTGRGYYTLPDGRQSDTMTRKEWKEALINAHAVEGELPEDTYRRYKERRLLQLIKLLYDGIEGIEQLHSKAFGRELVQPNAAEERAILYTLEIMATNAMTATGEDDLREQGKAPASHTQDYISKLLDEAQPSLASWSYYQTEPEHLSKLDILENALSLYGLDTNTEATAMEQFIEFKEDYPALFAAVEAYIKETVPSFKNIVPAQYFEELATWEELERAGVQGYEGVTDPELVSHSPTDTVEEDTLEEELTAAILKRAGVSRYQKKARAIRRGIAIIQNPPKEQVDKNGNYIEAPALTDAFTSLDKLADSEASRSELDALRDELIYPAARFIFSFNALMGIVGSVYGIEDLDTIQLDTEPLEHLFGGFNNLLYVFYGEVYGNRTERERKRDLIKALFPPLRIDALKPTSEAIQAVTAELTELGFTEAATTCLKNFDRFIAILSGEGGNL